MNKTELQPKTKVIFIKTYEDIEKVCKYLTKKYIVIVNISNTEFGMRYIDFISGFTYANNGKKEKIEDDIYSFKI